MGIDTAFAVWQRLATTYAPRSKAQVRTLKSHLFSFRRGNDNIADYMQRAKHWLTNWLLLIFLLVLMT